MALNYVKEVGLIKKDAQLSSGRIKQSPLYIEGLEEESPHLTSFVGLMDCHVVKMKISNYG